MDSVLAHVPRPPFSLEPLIAEAKRRARRRRWLILFVLVAAVAAVAATLELRSASGSGLAPVGGRPVVHVVMQWPPSTVDLDLKTGRMTVRTSGEKMWFEPGRNGWHHIISTVGGRTVADDLWKARYGPSTQAAAVDNFYAAYGTDFRNALASGKVKLVGRGTFEGHHIDWLSVVPRRDQRYYVLRALGGIGVDAHTYKPVLMRMHSGKRYVYTRILLAEAIPYNAADFKAHGPRQIPARPPYKLAPGYAFGSTNPSTPRSTVVRAPWLTAGTTVAGLTLRAVTPFTIHKTKHRFSYGAPKPKAIHGLALVYEPSSQRVAPVIPTPVNVYGRPRDALAATRFTIVYEVPRGRTVPWISVPAGSIEVQSNYTTVRNDVVPTPWIGYLKTHGLYVTISTPQGQRTPLLVARSLHLGRS